MKAKTKRYLLIVAGFICALSLFLGIGLWQSEAPVLSADAERYNVTSTVSAISSGVKETKYITNDLPSNTDQVVTYAIEVDLSQNTLIAGYKGYDTSGTWGMDTVRNHVTAAERARDVKIVAAVNGDFFNMATGEPTGALVMNGKEVHASGNRIYFAILEDNTAVIRTGELQGDEKEAIGAASMLVENGEVVPSSSDTVKQPRTAVGIKADGTVVLMVADGRQSPYSSGYSLYDLACKMKEAGCVVAANLDGGGSTTYLAKYAGTDELTLANSPSDGQERSVSSSLLVVSNAEPTGVFASAEISPNNLVYTPGSTIEFSAIGADTAGFPAEVPDEAYWRVSEEDAIYGEMTTLEGGNGEFVSNEATIPAEGTQVTVELVYQNNVVGSATVELRNPDTLSFSSSAVTLAFGQRTDLGFTATWQHREVTVRESGDLEWTIGEGYDSSGEPTGYKAGAMDGNTFVADEEALDTTSQVTVKSVKDPSISATVSVSVGQIPTVVWDFEDVYDEATGTTIPAEEYYSTTSEDSDFSVGNAGRGAVVSTQVVSSEDGYPVRMGSHSLRVDYDFTNITGTDGAYFGESNETLVPGKPTAVGVWMYVPEGTRNLWLRAYVNGYNYNDEGEIAYIENEDGEMVLDPAYKVTGSYAVINFTAQSQTEADALGIPYYADYIPAGWHYFEAPLATYSTTDGVTTTTPIAGDFYTLWAGQALRLMVVPGIGLGVDENKKGDKSYVYFDDFQFVYGAQTNDTNAPEITLAYIANPQGDIENAELKDGLVINSSKFQVHAQYKDYTNQFDTGVIPENIHIYIDGNELEYGSRTGTQDAEGNATQNEGNTQSLDYFVPNGQHVITIEVGDSAQNYTSKSFTVTVNGNSNFETVSLVPEQESAPLLNSEYMLELVATDMSKVDNVTFDFSLRSEFEMDVVPVEGFTVNSVLTNAVNNTYTITVEKDENVAAVAEGEGSIAKIAITIPKDLASGIPLVYSVDASKVTYIDGFQEQTEDGFAIMNSFCLEATVSVEAYYVVSTDILVVGNNDKYNAYIYVTHAGQPAAEVTLYIDGTSVGTTDENGKLKLPDSYLESAAVMQVKAEDASGNVSFATTAFTRVAAGDSIGPMFVSSKANEDSQTQQHISWLANPITSENKAIVRYMTAADYEANGNSFESGYTEFEGVSELLAMGETATATENHAVLVNSAEITGLKRNTEYVYIVGDGTNWSEVHYFSTTIDGENTNFFVIGDTQAENAANVETIAEFIGSSGIDYSFGIQTGDFVDSANSYAQWAEILNVFSSNFSNVDMVQVLGNHEYAGDLSGNIASTINMLPNAAYYSVTYGNTYVAVINYCDAAGLQDAIDWLIEDAQNSNAIWKVLTLHQPPYYTNPTGGSDFVNQLLPPAVDEAGIDVVFSGHDHAYARTLPMTGGQVDEQNGAVYFICGSTGEKSYDVYPSGSFNFAVATNDYNAVYISVEATDTEMTIITYNLGSGGPEIFDTYIIQRNNSCSQNGHSYVYEGEYIYCTACGYCMTDISDFSGFIQNTEGQNMFFTAGVPQTGWTPLGTDYYYFDEDGIGVNGEVTVTSDYAGQQEGDITFVFENGLKVGGHTGWYGEKYYDNGTFVTGWIDLDGDFYYLATGNDVGRNPGVSIGDKLKGGRRAVYTPTSPYFTIYYIYFDADGKYMHGDFHERGDNGSGQWAYTYVRVPSDPDGVWVNYCWDRWVETEYGMFYVQYNTIITRGEAVIDGVRYRFADEGTADPRTSGNGVLLGRYYDVEFVSDGTTVSSAEMFEGDKITAPAAPEVPAGNSIKSYTFAGWYNGDVAFADDVVTQDVTYTAKFDAVYTEKYNEIAGALEVLETAEELADKRAALYDVQELYNGLTAEEIADCEVEGLSFDTYRELLGELCTVTFVANNRVVFTANVLSGETVKAPATPAAPAGNSIKSYVFGGWFSGSTQFMSGAVTRGGTYTARFDTVYTSTYSSVAGALAVLNRAQTPSAQREAIEDLQPLYEALTERELADCEAEGLDFSLYRELVDDFCTVTFVADGENVLTVTILPGETVAAPAAPEVPAGNSIKTYTFAGWFSGDTAHTPELAITSGMTFEAVFDAVYTDNYTQLSEALSALEDAEGGTLSARYEALTAVYNARAAMTETELADSEAEGLSFALYDEMLADYNSVADGAKEDLDTATDAAAAIIGAVTAVAAAAAVAGFCIKRR